MFSTPAHPISFRRGVRLLPVFLVVALASLVATCTDAPNVPEGMGLGMLQIAPQISFAGTTTTAAEDALAEAFERVNRFRMQIFRLPSNTLALDTVLVVSPGEDIYDLRVDVEVLATNEQFSVVITALEGDTELFTSDPITVTASTETTGTAAPVAVTMTYSGPGATAVAIELEPDVMALAPGSSGTFTATVRDDAGGEVTNVPVSWSTGSGAVATVTDGGVATGMGGGVTSVVVTTPTGLTDEASLYVASGQLAFVRDGHVVVGDMMGTETTDRTPAAEAAEGPAWSPDGGDLFYEDEGQVMKAGGSSVLGGSWPSVSPDGLKLAVERGSGVVLANVNGTHETEGPDGERPVWTPAGSHLVVAGGSVEKVKADGTGRTVLAAGGGAGNPAVATDGSVAYVGEGGSLHVIDGDGGSATEVLGSGVSGRPTWSPDSRFLVFRGEGGVLSIVAASGSRAAAPLPVGEGSDPAWQPTGDLTSPPTLVLESLDPARPIAGVELDILGSGFDWIIPSNTHVFFPTPDGSVEGEVVRVGESVLKAMVPERVVEGTLRVETETAEATIAFNPAEGAVVVTVQTSAGEGVAGVGLHLLQGADTVASMETGDGGQVIFLELQAGTYLLRIVPSRTYSVVGSNPRTVVVELGVQARVDVEMQAVVQRVTVKPEDPVVAIGEGGVVVVASATNADGDPVTEFRSIDWAGVTGDIRGRGNDLNGILTGKYPSAAEGAATFRVNLNGDGYDFPATVTSYIEGTLQKESGPAPAGVLQGPDFPVIIQTLQVTGSPQAASPVTGAKVRLFQDGREIASTTSKGDGKYRFDGLLAGTYMVQPVAPRGTRLITTEATVALSSENPTGNADFSVVDETVETLTISPPTAEKLPGGTQQFTVTEGPEGPYTWLVRGVEGGSETFGTVSEAGLYQAPGEVPDPATFDVCARVTANPATQGCAQVTIEPIPTAGEDVVVFNDINVFDNSGMDAGVGNPNNRTMVRNLVTFTSGGPRGAETVVWFDRGRASKCAGTGECSDGSLATMRSVIQDAGYAIESVSSGSGTLTDIPGEVKVLFLWNPMVIFTWQEINALKSFAAEGGRIVYIGEYASYLGTLGVAVENQFLADMGAEMTNIGAAVECGYRDLPGSVLREHQVTEDMAAVRVACASVIVPGPNDFPLFFDSSNTKVLAGVAKIDVTPLTEPLGSPTIEMRLLRSTPSQPMLGTTQLANVTASGEHLAKMGVSRR